MNKLLRPTILLTTLSLVSIANAVVYDAATDFSIGSNPNGVWSYGWSSTLTGGFNLNTASSSVGVIDFSSSNIASDGNPQVFKNTSNATVIAGSVTLFANQMAMHPGPNGEYAVVRFTVPATTMYVYTAGFIGQDASTTDVHVLVNGALNASGSINGYGSTVNFGNLWSLAAGDTIELRVGYGNGNFLFDSTGANIRIEAVPEPATMSALALGMAFLARRKSAK